MIHDSFLQDAINRIVVNYAPEQILLFGSNAKKQTSASSDIDLLIIKDTTVPMARRGRNIRTLFANSPVKLDLIFYTPAEVEAERAEPYSFIDNVLQCARLIYSSAEKSNHLHHRP